MDDLVKRAKDAMVDHNAFVADQGGKILSHGLMPELVARIEALEAEVARLRDGVRLIELIGYREGEDFGWINAHMRGVATSILSDESIAHYWRLFPNRRRRATLFEIGSDK
jgi:hypothetical protein